MQDRTAIYTYRKQPMSWCVYEAFPLCCLAEPGLVFGCANGLDRTGAVDDDPPNPAASNSTAFDAFDTVLECNTPSDSATESRYIDDTDRPEKCAAVGEGPITSSTIRPRSRLISSLFASGSMSRVPSCGGSQTSSLNAEPVSDHREGPMEVCGVPGAALPAINARSLPPLLSLASQGVP